MKCCRLYSQYSTLLLRLLIDKIYRSLCYFFHCIKFFRKVCRFKKYILQKCINVYVCFYWFCGIALNLLEGFIWSAGDYQYFRPLYNFFYCVKMNFVICIILLRKFWDEKYNTFYSLLYICKTWQRLKGETIL